MSIHTLGCKLNYAEGETFLRACEAQGYEVVDFGKPADLVVINTCSVTEQADRKCRAVIAKAKRTAPHASVVVTGCYAQLRPQQLASLPQVDQVVGTQEKYNFFSNIERSLAGPQVQVSPISLSTTFQAAHSFRSRTRAFLKVQDGCDYGCSFCTIPLARGISRSPSIATLSEQLVQLVRSGAQEVVLSGVNIGDFKVAGKHRGQGLLELLHALDKVPEGPKRFRISSIEPNLLSAEIIAFVAEHDRWMPHFHLPLQAGSNAVLAGMRRRYKTDLYANKVAAIKALMPDACIGVDVMVGFPTETADDFKQTYTFLQDIDIQYLHVFPFAKRPHTLAANMSSMTTPALRQERAAQLRNLSLRKQNSFYRSYLAKSRPLLLEQEERAGFRLGFTDNYLRTGLPVGSPVRPGELHQVRIQQVHPDGFLQAELSTD